MTKDARDSEFTELFCTHGDNSGQFDRERFHRLFKSAKDVRLDGAQPVWCSVLRLAFVAPGCLFCVRISRRLSGYLIRMMLVCSCPARSRRRLRLQSKPTWPATLHVQVAMQS